MPNVSDMDKDALAAVIKQLYDQSCSVFAEKAEYHNKNNQNINPPPPFTDWKAQNLGMVQKRIVISDDLQTDRADWWPDWRTDGLTDLRTDGRTEYGSNSQEDTLSTLKVP